MDLYNTWSQVRRSLSRNKKNPSTSATTTTSGNGNKQQQKLPEEYVDEQVLGVTEQLIDFVNSFTVDTFKNFPLHDDESNCGDESPSTTTNVRKDLSLWQERHATLVLSKVKEISKLRYQLCPRHLKERQFWRIYFKLVKRYVAEYELQAVRLAKLKRMGMDNERSFDTTACEVEMAEGKQGTNVEDDLISPLV